jgi:hypothetical protein
VEQTKTAKIEKEVSIPQPGARSVEKPQQKQQIDTNTNVAKKAITANFMTSCEKC